jgi:hypothetical protein
MANRFHGNSYDDVGVDFVDVAASMVRSHFHYLFPFFSIN